MNLARPRHYTESTPIATVCDGLPGVRLLARNAPDESKGSSPMIRTQSVLLWIVGKVSSWRIVGRAILGAAMFVGCFRERRPGLFLWQAGKNADGIIPRKQPPAHLKFKGE